MEIARLGVSSVKIKAKNVSFVINPDKKNDGEVVILTAKAQNYSSYQGKLVIDGPGEYEVAGVSIHGDQIDGKLSFDFLEDNQRILVLSSPLIAKSKETEDYTATVVMLTENSGTLLSQISSEVILVVGPEEMLPPDKSLVKKADKVNLKRVEENKGFIIHLSK